MQAVREAVSIPVLANGNIRNLQDVHDCIAYTGVEGVMSAESLLEDPALFWPHRLTPEGTQSQCVCMCVHSTALIVLYTGHESQPRHAEYIAGNFRLTAIVRRCVLLVNEVWAQP
jgi:tRNA-dihydrouridine synthase